MQSNKGKSINTSVPSITIRFNANAEEIEELYQSEEESTDKSYNEKSKSGGVDPEGSPLRHYLPRLGKRSPSIDTSLSQDSLPPSDRWKFFQDIKGKITKSVEDTLTEIKHRNQEAEVKKYKLTKDKDNSSFSESEDLSESSISKTCGIVSTTEGAEMSSDDETPSLEKDKLRPLKTHEATSTEQQTSKHRFKILKPKKATKDSMISVKTLANLYEISTGIKPSVSEEKTREEAPDIESGVEAVEDVLEHNANASDLACSFETDTLELKTSTAIVSSSVSASIPTSNVASTEPSESEVSDASNVALPSSTFAMPSTLPTQTTESSTKSLIDDQLITTLIDQIDNLDRSEDNVLQLHQVTGNDFKQTVAADASKTFLFPEGFVDLRTQEITVPWSETLYSYRYTIGITLVLLIYFSLPIPVYFNGFIAGAMSTLALISIYMKFSNFTPTSSSYHDLGFDLKDNIFEIPAVKEHQPLTKFEGWMNEYPELYNPQTYHISQTQSVYIRLQGNLLRISHTRSKIPKRAMWNEPKHRHSFSYHRIYNLANSKIMLLPEGLNRKRQWSKKYPICIAVTNEEGVSSFLHSENFSVDEDSKSTISKTRSETSQKSSRSFLRRRKNYDQPQLFSKLTEDDEREEDFESESSRPASPIPDEISYDISEDKYALEDDMDEVLYDAEDDQISYVDFANFQTRLPSPNETYIYLFGRTSREKEDWYRRLVAATCRNDDTIIPEAFNTSDSTSQLTLDFCSSTNAADAAKLETEYLQYMAKYQKFGKTQLDLKITQEEFDEAANVIWVNAFVGRILFDCIRSQNFKNLIKEKIQRKLSAIRLPYFIEQITMTELSLGSNSPMIHKASKPVIDQRGLWIDLALTYEGSVVMFLQTKLNLMRLKQPPPPATVDNNIFVAKWQNSDVEDTPESSTDDDIPFSPVPSKVLDDTGNLVQNVGGYSNSSKKIIKFVDHIAASKFFQAATEYRYIKKAMEGVSNTELGLKVDVKSLVGTLVLNIPPPPSDRIWIGFRPTPKLQLAAHPVVGERNISFFRYLSGWIEKKLLQEFQKLMVIPNMEDIMIPMMSPNLPQ